MENFHLHTDGLHSGLVRDSDGAGLAELHAAGECPRDCTLCTPEYDCGTTGCFHDSAASAEACETRKWRGWRTRAWLLTTYIDDGYEPVMRIAALTRARAEQWVREHDYPGSDANPMPATLDWEHERDGEYDVFTAAHDDIVYEIREVDFLD